MATIAAMFGVILSLYALIIHYGGSEGGACNLSARFSCDIVNRGPWSEISGIPVAGIGIAGYAALLLFLFFKPFEWERWFLLGTISGLLFSLYLTYLEAFVIRSFCVVCLASLADIAMLTVLGVLFVREKRFSHDKPQP
jgi:uncharacterized membrane protein